MLQYNQTPEGLLHSLQERGAGSDKGEKCREITWPGRQVPEAKGGQGEQDAGLP